MARRRPKAPLERPLGQAGAVDHPHDRRLVGIVAGDAFLSRGHRGVGVPARPAGTQNRICPCERSPRTKIRAIRTAYSAYSAPQNRAIR
jgi:hypothetical protein